MYKNFNEMHSKKSIHGRDFKNFFTSNQTMLIQMWNIMEDNVCHKFPDKQFITEIQHTKRNTNFISSIRNIRFLNKQKSRNLRRNPNRKYYCIYHDSHHFLQGIIITFDNPNLMRLEGSRNLMSNPFNTA